MVEAIPFYANGTNNAIGGRGGKIYRVTNLNDSGAGSLRYGIEEIDQPRNIVFDISGTILLDKAIKIRHPYISIFGQTAPGNILITGGGISIQTYEVILQHLAVRPSDLFDGHPPSTRDGLEILGTDNIHPYNVVIDHCSITHAIDENISLWGGVSNVTISNSVIAVGLHSSLHSKGPHSKGILIGADSKSINIFNNILAFNDERNPRITGKTSVKFFQNLVYGCNTGAQVLDVRNAGALDLEMHSNIFRPEQSRNMIIKKIAPESRVITYGNTVEPKNMAFNSQLRPSMNLNDLEQQLLENSGQNPHNRNQVDLKILSMIKAGEVQIFDCSSEYITTAKGKVIRQNRNEYSVSLERNSAISKEFFSELYISRNDQYERISSIRLDEGSIRTFYFKMDRPLQKSYIEIYRKCDSYFATYFPKSHFRIFGSAPDYSKDTDGNGYSQLEDSIYAK